MEVLIELPAYINDRWHLIFQYLGQHANLIPLAIILAVILGVAGGSRSATMTGPPG